MGLADETFSEINLYQLKHFGLQIKEGPTKFGLWNKNIY